VLLGNNGGLAPHLEYFKHSSCAHPDPETPWPQGNGLSPVMPGVEQVRLQAALSEAFRRQNNQEVNPRAIVAVYKGKLVAERYAKGFGPGAGLPGWSMTKSVLSALVGIAVKQGILKVDQPAQVEAWQRPGDPRAFITLEHLLHMSSGLCFSERYGEPFSDVAQMLYGSSDTAKLAMQKEMCAEPGVHFEYSSGASNIISYLLRQALGDDKAYLDFAHKELFCPLGMSSPLLAPDASGTLVGSTNMVATARDWARIGQLYLEDGVWQGRRILPKGWVDYTRSPAPASQGRYGAHWWLNRSPKGAFGKAYMPGLPGDTFFAYGFGGQFLTVVPSKKLVVVGLRFYRASDQKVMALQNKLVAGVIAGLPE
jgi:CubicO group peptidase (beta-lactamase class C family)